MNIALSLIGLLSGLAAALEVNSATRAQLERLQGLGVATVDRVLRAREERVFKDWNDLAARVPGLSGKRAEALDRLGLTVDGKRLPPAAERRK